MSKNIFFSTEKGIKRIKRREWDKSWEKARREYSERMLDELEKKINGQNR